MKKYLALTLPIIFLAPAITGMDCVAPGPGADKKSETTTPTESDRYDCYPGGAPYCNMNLFRCAYIEWVEGGQQGTAVWVAGPDKTTTENCIRAYQGNDIAVECKFDHIENPSNCEPVVQIDWEIDCQSKATGEWWFCSDGVTNAPCNETTKQDLGEKTCNVWTNQNWYCKYTTWNCK